MSSVLGYQITLKYQISSNLVFAAVKIPGDNQKLWKIKGDDLTIITSITIYTTYYNPSSAFEIYNGTILYAFKGTNPSFISITGVNTETFTPYTYIHSIYDSPQLQSIQDPSLVLTIASGVTLFDTFPFPSYSPFTSILSPIIYSVYSTPLTGINTNYPLLTPTPFLITYQLYKTGS